MPRLLLCLALTSGLVTPAEMQADPREQVSTAVTYGIGLLEKKEHKRFLLEFVSPDEMKQVFGQEAVFDNLVQQFAKEKAPQILEALRDVQKLTPKYEEGGQLALFPLKTPIGRKSTLAFVKIGKYWYIKN